MMEHFIHVIIVSMIIEINKETRTKHKDNKLIMNRNITTKSNSMIKLLRNIKKN